MVAVQRILALDPGSRRIGVAISDRLGVTAQPLAVVPAEPLDEALAGLVAMVREHHVGRVVVGWPRNMDGSEGAAAAAARVLRGRLQERLRAAGLACDTVLFDERLTSRMAERSMLEADLSRRRRRGVIDRVAAQLLLQSYLDARRQPRAEGDAGANGGKQTRA